MTETRYNSPGDVYPERVLALNSKLACRVWYHLRYDRDDDCCPLSELWAVGACRKEGLRKALHKMEEAGIVESEYGHDSDARERVICFTSAERERICPN